MSVFTLVLLVLGGCCHDNMAQQVLSMPSVTPSQAPITSPSMNQSIFPTRAPLTEPSTSPSVLPTMYPTSVPTVTPSKVPSYSPSEPEECVNELFMTITLGPSSINAFESSSIITQWQTVTSDFIAQFYADGKNEAEDGSTIEIFNIYTTYATHYKYVDNIANSRNLKASVKYTDLGVFCETLDDEPLSNKINLEENHFRKTQSNYIANVYTYFSVCLTYRPSTESTVLGASDIITYPFAGRLGRERYILQLNEINGMEDIISVTRIQVKGIPDDPSAAPSASPFGAPSSSPSATFTTASDTWAGLRQSAVLTCVVAVFLLITFEVCRRLEMTSGVFDRRRSSRPLSTPPPLMKRTFYEWLRVNTSPSYTVWAGKVAAQEKIQKNSKHLKPIGEGNMEPDIIEETVPGEEEKIDNYSDDLSRWSDDTDDSDRGTPTIGRTGSNKSFQSNTSFIISSEYEIESLVDQKVKKVISSPTDDDLDLLEEGKTLGEVKRLRRQRLGIEMVPGKVIMPGKVLSVSNADAIIKGRIDGQDLEILEQNESNLDKMKAQPKTNQTRLLNFTRKLNKARNVQNSSHVRKELINRLEHLGTDVSGFQENLSPAERELLRCVGLDTFCMLRFLKLGFKVSFVSFVVASITLIPVYSLNDYNGYGTNGGSGVVTVGYYDITYNKLESGSHKFWILWAYSIWFLLYVLFTLWREWEFFVVLRFEFLAARSFEQGMDELQLLQYRNSCMVDCIPPSYRSDREIYKYFDAIFPGQVKRAELLVNASHLTQLIEERRRNICLYEDTYAKHVHAKSVHVKEQEKIQQNQSKVGACSYICYCLTRDSKYPSDPMINIGNRFQQTLVKALPHYLSEIKRLNLSINEEADRLLKARKELRLTMKKGKKYKKTDSNKSSLTRISSIIVSNTINVINPVGILSKEEMISDTAFVEFKNVTTKESAVQCNISGTSNFISCRAAPTPNDIVWENATISQIDVDRRKWRVNMLLLVAVLFWTPVVTAVSNIGNPTLWISAGFSENDIPSDDSFLGGTMMGVLPVIILEVLMIVVVYILKIIGTQYIQFKTKSECDEFVLVWHFAFRLVNLLAIMVSGGLVKLLNEENFKDATEQLAAGIASNSDFFLDNAIVGAGAEALLELAQIPKIFISFMIIRLIKTNAKSQRALEKLEECEEINFDVEILIYAPLVPLVNLGCAIYFFCMYKVWHHQALFVYAQQHEGGGRFIYILNRMIFIALYISILVTTTVFALNEAHGEASTFAYLMTIITVAVDYKIQTKFVKPSATLALLRARELDEQDKLALERAEKFRKLKGTEKSKEYKMRDEGSKANVVTSTTKHDDHNDRYYLYRQPFLNKLTWETKPRRYR